MATSVASSRTHISEMAKIAIVAALYVTVTVLLAPFSFGPVQLRVSEMFNFFALYHKRYIYAVTLGVIIANFYSPTWIIDVPLGGIATFLVLILCRRATKNIENTFLKYFITICLFAASMFTVAFQLNLLIGYPFWETYLFVAIGEILSMSLGGVLIHMVSKKINFEK